jgi:hypothetical protein
MQFRSTTEDPFGFFPPTLLTEGRTIFLNGY